MNRAGGDDPKVALVLIAYRQEALVREAIEAAFAQDYSPLDIILSDDQSPDGTYSVMEEMCREYAGPHTIICRQNSRNLGLIGHLNAVNDEVDADLIIHAAGDDRSAPSRVRRNVEAYNASGRQAHYIFSLVRNMEYSGKLQGVYQSAGWVNRDRKWHAALSSFPISIGAAAAWTKDLVTRFGPIDPYVWTEDQVLGFRGVLAGHVAFIDEPLVDYRMGGLTNQGGLPGPARYVRNQWNGINIYRQRAKDAWRAGEPALALAIRLKWLFLIALFPASPLFSLLRRRLARTRGRQAGW